MNELDTYIPPNIRLITRSLSGSHTNWRFTADELPTWVEQSQDLMLWSTVSFLIVTYSGTFLSLNHLPNCIFPCPLLLLTNYALRAGYLFVADTLSTPAITEPPSVEGQVLLIPRQIETTCSQNRPWIRLFQSPPQEHFIQTTKSLVQIQNRAFWQWARGAPKDSQ